MMNKATTLIRSVFLVTCLALTQPAMADTHTWVGSVGSDWFDGANWTPSGPPAAGDSVVYTNDGTALILTNETPFLNDFTMRDGTLTCSNWPTRIQATNVTIEGGTITLPPAFTNGGMSNRVWIACSNDFTLATGAEIDVTGKGYAAQHGPGAGSISTTGAGHGGKGGAPAGGGVYGSPDEPTVAGSGGYYAANAPAGGGTVRIHAQGQATVNGEILADGVDGGAHYTAGGGSGGAIWISCHTLAGNENGLLSVAGGDGGTWSGSRRGGGGGGGRIAVTYSAVQGSPAVAFAASPGIGLWDSANHGQWSRMAGNGTLFLSDTGLLSTTLSENRFTDVNLYLANGASWAPASLTVSNCSVILAADVSVGGDLRVDANGTFGVCGKSLTIASGGNLAVTNGGVLRLYAGPTNETSVYGGGLDVAGTVAIGPSSWMYVYSDPTNAGSMMLRMTDLTVAAGGGINADGKGCWDGYGPGMGTGFGGAGYGGAGGQGQSGVGGPTYGSTNAPAAQGSGGSDNSMGAPHVAGSGGGLLRVEVDGAVRLDGTIEASGSGCADYSAGGGSGGGIFIWCAETFTGGSAGVLRADGGDGGYGWSTHRGGGGGGGRIAVWHQMTAGQRDEILGGSDIGQTVTNTHTAFPGALSVTNGVGSVDDYNPSANPAEPGTVVFVSPPVLTPDIENLPPTNIATTSAFLNGQLVSTGGSPVTVSVYWGSADGEAPADGLWEETNTWAQGVWVEGSRPTYQATGLTENDFHYYRYRAENASGTEAALTSQVFLAGNVWVTAPDPDADEVGEAPGVFTIQRHADATNEPTTVTFSYGGSASPDDFTASPPGTVVVLPPGVSSTNITITPNNDADGTEGNETVVLVLQPGLYAIGSPASNAVTIADESVAAGLNATVQSGNWNQHTIWSLGRRPIAGDEVVVSNAVTISNMTEVLASVTITNATLTFQHWNSALRATNVVIASGATVALPAAFAEGEASNRVWIVCSNDFVLSEGATIDVAGKGYAAENGPGAGTAETSGGGYGGKGGAPAGGAVYGSPDEPTVAGSGGYHAANAPTGGGAVRIHAQGQATVNGEILADGVDGGEHYAAGGGSGGAIWISCHTLAGNENGLLSVAGGDGGTWAGNPRGGGGGGGRIAVTYSAIQGSPAVAFAASPGIGLWDSANHGQWSRMAGNGTLFLSDTSLLSTTLSENRFTDVNLYLAGGASWAPESLTVSNCSVILAADVSIGGDLRVDANGTFGVCGKSLTIASGGNLAVTNGGVLRLYAGPTNETSVYGTVLDVAGTVAIGPSSWIFPYSDPTNGGSVLLRMQDIAIATGGGIDASGKGYVDGYGPGLGGNSCGAGYGGVGGQYGTAKGGPTYGYTNAPTQPGSGGNDYNVGAPHNGGSGGGLVRIEANGAVQLDGTIAANGSSSVALYTGAGSGGGIFVWCSGTFSGGVTSVLRVDGGDAAMGWDKHFGGGGGGGRIAVWYKMAASWRNRLLSGTDIRQIVSDTHPGFLGSLSVTNGLGSVVDQNPSLDPAEPGTVVFLTPPPSGTIFMIR